MRNACDFPVRLCSVELRFGRKATVPARGRVSQTSSYLPPLSEICKGAV